MLYFYLIPNLTACKLYTKIISLQQFESTKPGNAGMIGSKRRISNSLFMMSYYLTSFPKIRISSRQSKKTAWILAKARGLMTQINWHTQYRVIANHLRSSWFHLKILLLVFFAMLKEACIIDLFVYLLIMILILVKVGVQMGRQIFLLGW